MHCCLWAIWASNACPAIADRLNSIATLTSMLLRVKQARVSLQGLAIDAGGIAIFGYLLKRDLDARDKQIARMTREEDLGGLQIELANKKTLRLAQLRQFARIVSRFVL